ncbi:MAG: family 10 glycosylhydrolase [Bacteroidota bacterium]
MKDNLKNIFYLTLFFSSISFPQSPKHEFRAVWLSSASGDWPTSYNVEEQQESLIEILDVLKKNNFNAIFFQVRPRGNTLYRSEIEPWAQQLTGELGKDPGWDPLQFAIDETRKRGMELHAWFNVAKVWGSDSPPQHPRHVVKAHYDWVRQVNGEWWIDLGNPDAREYTEHVVMELVTTYDIDGIHFDFIRYPNSSFDDWRSFSKWSDGMERDEWRRNNVTTFVRNCYAQIRAVKPWIKVGSAPIGIYQSINGAQSAFSGYEAVFQDARRWLREGVHDYLAPQLYWSIGVQQNPNDPDFAALCYDWARESYGRQVYAGIGIYREHVLGETAEQVLAARNAMMEGQSFFRYGQLAEAKSQLRAVYRYPALVPPMKWKDSIPPLPPKNIFIERNDRQGTIIRWSEPDIASDGEKPFRYAVYRSTTLPVDIRKAEHLVAVVASGDTEFIDNTVTFNGTHYYYTVTSLDRNWNESASKQMTSDVTMEQSRYTGRPSVPVLAQNVPNPVNGRTFISFTLPKQMEVELIIKHTTAPQERVLVKGMKNRGVHVIAVDVQRFSPGTIEYQLTAGDVVITKVFEKK